MRRALALTIVVCFVGGCAMSQQRQEIRSGLLRSGIHQEAFLAEWGTPVRAYSQMGEQVLKKGLLPTSRRVRSEQRLYDTWEYPDLGVTLLFYGYRLVGWFTEKTVEELRQGQLKARGDD